MIQAKEIVKMMMDKHKAKLKYVAFAVFYLLLLCLARYIGIKYQAWIQAHATIVSLSLFVPGSILIILVNVYMLERDRENKE